MTMRWWVGWAAVACAAAAAGAQVPMSDGSYGPDLDADALLEQILNEPPSDPPAEPVSMVDVRFSAGMGYNDNVLYSSVLSQESAFSLVEVDAYAMRRNPLGDELYGYTFAEQRHYFELERADDEQTVLAEAGWLRAFSGAPDLRTTAHYLYIDQFFDASLSDADIQSLRLRQHEAGAEVGAELAPGPAWRLRLAGAARAVNVVDFDDDYDAWEGIGECVYRWGPAAEAGLRVEVGMEDYDDRDQRSAAGDRIEGETVRISTESLCIFGRWYWGPDRRWRMQWKWTAYTRDDNGGGYYDYRSWRGRLSILGPLGRGQWEGGVYYGNTDYDVRPSRAGDVAGPLLYRNRLQAWLRLEQPLRGRWEAIAELSWEDNDANDPLDVYAQLKGHVGLGFRL